MSKGRTWHAFHHKSMIHTWYIQSFVFQLKCFPMFPSPMIRHEKQQNQNWKNGKQKLGLLIKNWKEHPRLTLNPQRMYVQSFSHNSNQPNPYQRGNPMLTLNPKRMFVQHPPHNSDQLNPYQREHPRLTLNPRHMFVQKSTVPRKTLSRRK